MIHAVFFDIGGTVHTQDATPESDRDYIRRLWCFLHMNHIYTAETPEQLLEHINAGAKAYKSYTEQELIELPPDVIWQKFFLKDFDIPAEKLAGLGEELCYMFDRYRKHIVKREGLKETLEALRQRGYRLGVISNIMSTTFVTRILKEHGVDQYFETLTMKQRLRHPQTAAGDFRDRAERNENRERTGGLRRRYHLPRCARRAERRMAADDSGR